jgi:hypothetical protein
MYEDEELRPYIVDPHKQTLIDLQYHMKKLKTDGHEVLIFMDAGGRKQSKATAGSSSSFSEKRADKSMDTYEDIAHDMVTAWANMCESEDNTSDQNNVSQGYSTPIQGKAGKN